MPEANFNDPTTLIWQRYSRQFRWIYLLNQDDWTPACFKNSFTHRTNCVEQPFPVRELPQYTSTDDTGMNHHYAVAASARWTQAVEVESRTCGWRIDISRRHRYTGRLGCQPKRNLVMGPRDRIYCSAEPDLHQSPFPRCETGKRSALHE